VIGVLSDEHRAEWDERVEHARWLIAIGCDLPTDHAIIAIDAERQAHLEIVRAARAVVQGQSPAQLWDSTEALKDALDKAGVTYDD
jgi:hypothetical protein